VIVGREEAGGGIEADRFQTDVAEVGAPTGGDQ
jgi:hypothetical protein